MDPACTVFHYAQEIFEGMKCYRRKDGGLNLFRPRDNFARMNRSAERMGMPKIDVEEAMAGLVALLKADADWVPSAPGTSLYIRPTMISTDVMLGRTRFPYIPLLHYLFALRCVLRQGAGSGWYLCRAGAGSRSQRRRGLYQDRRQLCGIYSRGRYCREKGL